MPKKTFYLDTAKTESIEISWGFNWKNFCVAKNKEIIGNFENKQELQKGKLFTLANNNTISAQLKKTKLGPELEILYNGKPVPGSATDPHFQVKTAFILLLVIGILNIVVGVITELGDVQMLKQLGAGLGIIIVGAIYIILAFLVKQKHSLTALYMGIVLLALDVILIIIYGAETNRIPVYGIILKICFIVYLMKAIKAIKTIKSSNVV